MLGVSLNTRINKQPFYEIYSPIKNKIDLEINSQNMITTQCLTKSNSTQIPNKLIDDKHETDLNEVNCFENSKNIDYLMIFEQPNYSSDDK